MGIKFNADEVFEMAEEMERNGAKFYSKAAEMTEDGREKGLLLGLSLMEQEHEKVFATLRSELDAADAQGQAFDPYDEGSLYLKALAENAVFDYKSDPWEKLTGSESLLDILHVAVGLERDSILFYLGMKKLVPNALGKDKIESIIQEEMGHITTLNKHIGEFSC